ncbi:GntR family transcriptional regulator [Rhizobium sp. CG5]|uniref:GntR family transcriptional regulator n=1 Tax=Rhizobium sp. CG5 TaxID=2726076 RepID=UPI002033D1BB|nr:GntR family transcriptional regulator [Rhizobium sp. CG5]MCM2474785.1 GntR family transcriptional regulator [Rhizobium sp. CG5]
MASPHESQSHQAYRVLEQLIVTLKLAPGALVNERELIERSGHGRTPVREAIQRLDWQGLILVRPRVGLQIADIHPEDLRQIMAVRGRLEPLAAGLAAQAATDEQRAALVDCAKAMTGAATSGDFDGFLAADKRFDEILEAACPNAFLISALQPLQTHARRLWYAQATLEKMDRSVALHVGVIRAIQQGDAALAQSAMENLIGYLSQA